MSPFSQKKVRKKIGGIVFYSSLLSLMFVAPFHLRLLYELLDASSIKNLCYFGAGVAVGAWLPTIFIHGHLNVLLHEVKHSVVSGLVGNRALGMRIKKDHGHFRYSYTSETAPYNAFISLAPYWFPLISTPCILLAIALLGDEDIIIRVILGFGAGADLTLNIRDIAEHQTDFSDIRGGYQIGLIYVVAMNTVLLSILLAWIMQHSFGFKYLLDGWWALGQAVFNLFS
ncbi:MAG: hypothetical protein KDD42_03590 [Bdellovibrionales bacterium]|nr:hypothetical protein [Bdellovibrionales bacterium]